MEGWIDATGVAVGHEYIHIWNNQQHSTMTSRRGETFYDDVTAWKRFPHCYPIGRNSPATSGFLAQKDSNQVMWSVDVFFILDGTVALLVFWDAKKSEYTSMA